MQRAARLIAKTILWLLVAALLGCAATVEYAHVQHLQFLSVQTGSMRPLIRPGDAVLVTNRYGRLAVGDIVSYHSLANPKLTITHRIVTINPLTGAIVTKGDALTVCDPPFGADRIIGKVNRVVPMVGYSFDFIRHPLGLLVALYVPAIIIVVGEIKRLMQYYDSQHYVLTTYW